MVTLHDYKGPKIAVGQRLRLDDDTEAWVLDWPTAAPLAGSCDDSIKCGQAVLAACKSLGKNKPGGVTAYKWQWLIGPDGKAWNSCSGTCADGGYVYISCVSVGKN